MARTSHQQSIQALAAADGHEPSIVAPGGDLALHAEFALDGVDLVLTGLHGERVVIAGYCSTSEPPALMTASGARLAPELVKLLAVDGTQFAQATAPGLGQAIGQVRNLTGSA